MYPVPGSNVLGRSAQPAARRSAFDPQLYRPRHDCGTTGRGQIPSNIGHQEGKHRADSGAPPALGLAGAMITEYPSSTGATTNQSTSRSGPPPRRSTYR
jgi:hypothetical protein